MLPELISGRQHRHTGSDAGQSEHLDADAIAAVAIEGEQRYQQTDQYASYEHAGPPPPRLIASLPEHHAGDDRGHRAQ